MIYNDSRSDSSVKVKYYRNALCGFLVLNNISFVFVYDWLIFIKPFSDTNAYVRLFNLKN